MPHHLHADGPDPTGASIVAAGRRRDRRGRALRVDQDPRRRPTDGFRTATRRRFARVAAQAVARQALDVAHHVRDARVVVVDLPPGDALALVDLGGDMPLARAVLAGPGHALVEVYRRPTELRAASREDLLELLTEAVRAAVLDALGRP